MAGVQVDVELREPSEAFLHGIERTGATVVSSLGSRCRLSLPQNADDPAALIFRVALDTGAQVRAYKPALRSLEDVFMEAIR